MSLYVIYISISHSILSHPYAPSKYWICYVGLNQKRLTQSGESALPLAKLDVGGPIGYLRSRVPDWLTFAPKLRDHNHAYVKKESTIHMHAKRNVLKEMECRGFSPPIPCFTSVYYKKKLLWQMSPWNECKQDSFSCMIAEWMVRRKYWSLIWLTFGALRLTITACKQNPLAIH